MWISIYFPFISFVRFHSNLTLFSLRFQKEINDVLQQFNSTDEIDSCGGRKSLKRNSKCKPKVNIDRDNSKYIETNEWANNVLKELDNIKLYDEKSNLASGVAKNADATNVCNIPKPKKHVSNDPPCSFYYFCHLVMLPAFPLKIFYFSFHFSPQKFHWTVPMKFQV